MKIGDTFVWSPRGRIESRKAHLYIAITDPNHNGGNFVAFNLTKSNRGPKALTLKVGQHPFITKYDSDVNFGDGLIVNIVDLRHEIARGQAIPDVPMEMELVERIARSAKGHLAVSGEIEKMIVAEWKL